MRRRRALYVVEVGSTTYVLDEEDRVHEFNDTASLAWSCLHDEVQQATLVSRIVTLTGANESEVGRDISGFLDDLLRLGLIESRRLPESA